jgi:hypothetical protein
MTSWSEKFSFHGTGSPESKLHGYLVYELVPVERAKGAQHEQVALRSTHEMVQVVFWTVHDTIGKVNGQQYN